jgi:hypothetical protein
MQDQRGMVTAARKEGKKEVAQSMRQKGYEPNLIAELTGLSLDAIARL